MGPLAEEPFGQLGVFARRAHEVAEGPEYAAFEPVPRVEEGRRPGREPHTFTLQLLEGFPAGRDLRQGFLRPPPLGPQRGLPLPGLRDEVTRVVRVGSRAGSFVTAERRLLERGVPAPLGVPQLGVEPRT